MPKIVQRRPIVFILGPPGVGKTKVALRLAQPDYAYFERTQIESEINGVAAGAGWTERICQTPAVVLDVPMYLDRRPGICRLVVDLINDRAARGLRTMLCQPAESRTIDSILASVDRNQIVVLGLRFPHGRRGRLRVARRMCEARNLDPEAARGTERIEPWNYAQVLAHLEEWARNHQD